MIPLHSLESEKLFGYDMVARTSLSLCPGSQPHVAASANLSARWPWSRFASQLASQPATQSHDGDSFLLGVAL